nr:MAG TPA: hypothetical protein [Caudoviricetes sp.]
MHDDVCTLSLLVHRASSMSARYASFAVCLSRCTRCPNFFQNNT